MGTRGRFHKTLGAVIDNKNQITLENKLEVLKLAVRDTYYAKRSGSHDFWLNQGEIVLVLKGADFDKLRESFKKENKPITFSNVWGNILGVKQE